MAPTKRLSFEVTLGQAAAILSDIPGAAPRGLERLQGGGTEVYRIDRGDGEDPLVLKLYADDVAWRAGKEQAMAALLEGKLAIPTPKWLALDQTRTRLPLSFAVTTWLPGAPIREWFGEADLHDLYRQVGALVRAFHVVPMPAYGYLRDQGLVDPEPTNAAYMAGAFGRALRRFRDLGGEEDLALRIERLAAEHADVTAEAGGPVLCHDDFHQGNILADRSAEGRLEVTGLVDFGNARSADALFDLAKALFCCAHEDPRSPGPILDGYGRIDHPDPPRALWYYTLFHRLSMWGWLTRGGAASDALDGPGGLLSDLRRMGEKGYVGQAC